MSESKLNKKQVEDAPDLLDALRRIAAILDADNSESYRCDDPEGAMDTAHALAVAAIAKAQA